MKFYGWKRGEWAQDDGGPASKHRKLKSRNRQDLRRAAKKRTRQTAKQALIKGLD